MTVLSQVSSYTYNGDGVSTVFPFSSYFIENGDLKVVLINADGSETPWVITTNYTVSGAGDPAGGSVTAVVAPAAGKQIKIYLDPPLTQQTRYTETGKFPAASHEKALDKLTQITQRLDARVDDLDDRVLSSEDVEEAAAAAAADAEQTALDRIATGQDRVATGEDRTAIESVLSDVTAAAASGIAQMTGYVNDGQAAALQAESYAESIVAQKFYTTKLIANGQAPSLANGVRVQVDNDESQDGARWVYTVSAGTLINPLPLVSLSLDHQGRRSLNDGLITVRSDGLRLFKAIADFKEGTRKSLRVYTIGDSLGAISWFPPNYWLARYLAGHSPSDPVYGYCVGDKYPNPAGTGTAVNSGMSGGNLATTSTASWVVKTDYDVSWTGSRARIQAGQAGIFAYANATVLCDRMIIPIVKKPGAGVCKIEIYTGAVANVSLTDPTWRAPTALEITSTHTLTGSDLLVDANGSFDLEIVELAIPLGYWCYKITYVSGGTIDAPRGMFECKNQQAVNSFFDAEASNDFSSTSATYVPLYAKLLKVYNPDVIVIGSADQKDSYQYFAPLLEAAIAASGLTHNPLVVFAGNSGYKNGSLNDKTLWDRQDWCKTWCLNRLGWDSIDCAADGGGYDELNRAGWANDGIHTDSRPFEISTRKWMQSRGYWPSYEVQPGGVIATITQMIAKGNQAIKARQAALTAIDPDVLDTGWMTWNSAVTNGGAFTKQATDLYFNTGATANATIVAYPGDASASLGNSYYRGGSKPGGFGFRLRPQLKNTGGLAYVLWSARLWNAAYAGDLTGEGFGFRITGNIIEGVAWNGTAQAVTSGSYDMTSFSVSGWMPLRVILDPSQTSITTGPAYFEVNRTIIGSLPYRRVVVLNGFQISVTNGASGGNFRLNFTPPKIECGA